MDQQTQGLSEFIAPMSLDNESEHILEAALSQAFSAPPSHRTSLQVSKPDSDETKSEEAVQSQPAEQPGGETSTGSEQASGVDTWREEYEAHVRTWRAQSAEAREKAEKERTKWEAIRAAEQEEGARRGPESKDSEWEAVAEKKKESSSGQAGLAGSSSEHAEPHEPHSRPDTTDESQKWEDIQSSETSSFPSMTFPERTRTPSPPPTRHRPPQAPETATLAIFDSSLSARTRVKAILASLAINLVLPFVNGVMLGFGEVFAKNVIIGWFGWRQPGSIASSVGVGASSQRQRQRQSR
ncbi:hypothetical protein AX17_007323 [Amanita inopinata Kibby_2008]|nr:hypothetical protein AX17_007323 [Amanita inopinata Kibby_2008]